MRVVLLTPGTGSYYCGVCMRDNALAKHLVRNGHDVLMLPMYLPLTLDEDAAPSGPVFFGGINVYLQQKSAFFRHTPRWVDALFNQGWMLRLAGRRSGMTAGPDIGQLTYSMLSGEAGRQAKELENLVDGLRELRPEAVWLSTGLLAGVARRIKEALAIPVLCSLQGEDAFLDNLPAPWKTRCWQVFAQRARELDRVIAPSRWFGEMMAGRLGLGSHQWRVIANGISLEGYSPPGPPPDIPVIGYLARLNESKGLGLMVEAFIQLRTRGKLPAARLRCAGTMTADDQAYLEKQKARLSAAGLLQDAEFLPNVARGEKIALLQSLSVLSVPALGSEAFGLYLVEAFAAGVPVVQPRSWAFPEIVDSAGAGLLCEPGDPEALCIGWEQLLEDPERVSAFRRKARAAAENQFSLQAMAEGFLQQTREMIDGRAPVG